MHTKAGYLALIVAVATLALVFFRPSPTVVEHMSQTTQKETAYERVLRTNTLRCGYAVYAPYLTKDANTGQMGGIWYDLTERMGEHLGIKIVWTEEVGIGDVSAALDAGRVDVFCGGLWTAGKRARSVDFLKPSAYEPILVYVRPDDHRFDNDISLINNKDIKVSTIDGEGGAMAISELYPNATLVSLPQLSGYADLFNQVVTKKADIAVAAPAGAGTFMKNNPDALRPLLKYPLKIYAVAYAIKYGESDLRDMLNQAQDDVIYNGAMDKILAAYEPFPGAFMRIAKPYVSSPNP